ncbi:hypothetical protein [Pelagicoccus mobilis]|uniref:Uncharacterized protein n=1 Tax=Pelagicoccus mobilis TaxID=415221 RepID=A0A934S2V1_9BACT|nr:hypothetical protein [Pelagicoccus mobilis]MBK1878817.1 hypothetical protein [Pelagicoccus mobilis]
MTPIRLLLALVILPVLPLQAQAPTDQLSEEEFKAAGLHKLTPEELATLNQLLTRAPSPPVTSEPNAATASTSQAAPQPPPVQPAASAPKPSPTQTASRSADDLYGKEQVTVDTKKAPKKIESRLQGTFSGWYGSTTFKLENGQVWMQRIREVQKYSPSENPKVTIFKSLGGYRIRIEGYRQTCPVKRIK